MLEDEINKHEDRGGFIWNKKVKGRFSQEIQISHVIENISSLTLLDVYWTSGYIWGSL